MAACSKVRLYHLGSAFYILMGLQSFSVLDRVIYGEWVGKPGDKLTEILNLLFIITSVALIGRRFHRTRSIRTGSTLAVGFVVSLLCSAAWSVSPSASLRAGTMYFFVIVGAIGVVSNLESDEFMDLVALMCFWAAVASLVLMVVSPANAYGTDGDFRGIFFQKNVLGQAMTMGALACLHGLRATKRRRSRGVFYLIVITFAAFKSASATSCLTILAFCGTDAFIVMIRKGGTARLLALGGVFVISPAVVLAALFPDTFLESIGKDPTLTGRTDIWNYVIPYIYQRPWLGWGHVAFWSSDNPAAVEIATLLGWFPPHAHNGILEMMLNVGLIGTTFLMFLWARNFRLSLRNMQTAAQPLAISCLLSCLGIILVGMSESVLMYPFEASTSIFFITGFFCEQAISLRRRSSTKSRHLE